MSPARRSWPERRPRFPTVSRGDRPIAGRNRAKPRLTSSNSSTTHRHRSTPSRLGSGVRLRPVAPDPIEQLKQLAELKNQGILTDAEFQAQKARILAS